MFHHTLLDMVIILIGVVNLGELENERKTVFEQGEGSVEGGGR